IARAHPARMAELSSVEGLLRARLMEGTVARDQWEAPREVLARLHEGPPVLAPWPRLPGEPERELELTFGIPAEMYGAFKALQKVSAWQEVARRLAHEIKNPLTPIQLSVQELASKYRGDDPAYRKLLDTAREILHEEITGLRRLVDDFSAFAKLPKVEPAPID